MPTVTIPTTTPAAVDTVDELADVSGAAGEAMIVAGFAAVGDGGGGAWTWSGASTATHDGYLVVRPDEIAADESGRWLRNYDGPIDARWFGCLPGLGSLLPQNAKLQLALDAVATIGRGHVQIAAGIYDWDDAVTIGSNTKVSGAGIGQTVIRGAAGGYTGKTVGGTAVYATLAAVAKSHITIEDLTIDHQTNATEANGIAFVPGTAYTGTACTDCTVRNVEILGYDAHEYLIWSMRGERMKFVNNRIDGYATDLSGSDLDQNGIEIYGGSDVLVSGNSIRRVGSSGVAVVSATPVFDATDNTGIVIIGNHVSAGRHGIWLNTVYDATSGAQNITDVVVADNVVRDCELSGIEVRAEVAGTTISGLLIEGNTVSDCPEPIRLYSTSIETAHNGIVIRGNVVRNATSTDTGAIYCHQFPNVTIEGNDITTSANNGIRCASMVNASIRNNKIRATTEDGILLNSLTDCDVSGNTVYDSTLAGITATSCTRARIAHNHVGGLGSSSVAIVATSNTRSTIVNNTCYRAAEVGGPDFSVSGTACVLAGNRCLYATTANSASNTSTAPNIGTTAAMTAGQTTIDTTATITTTSRFQVTQLTGAPQAFKVAVISGGFRITTAAVAVGDETFRWEVT